MYHETNEVQYTEAVGVPVDTHSHIHIFSLFGTAFVRALFVFPDLPVYDMYSCVSPR